MRKSLQTELKELATGFPSNEAAENAAGKGGNIQEQTRVARCSARGGEGQRRPEWPGSPPPSKLPLGRSGEPGRADNEPPPGAAGPPAGASVLGRWAQAAEAGGGRRLGPARPGPGERHSHLPERKGLRPTQGGLPGRRGRALSWGAEREEGRAEGSGAGRGRRYRGREAQNPLGQGGEGRSLRQWRRPRAGGEAEQPLPLRVATTLGEGGGGGARGGAVR